MKILLVTQYFWPESFKSNDLAEELSRRGHEVTILTGKPNYPKGKLYKGYSFFGKVKDKYKGMTVIRVPIIPRGNASGIRLALNYLSFVFSSCTYVLFNKKKHDVTITFAISPITQVYAALLDKWKHKSQAFLWVQDLWPESVQAAGKLNSGIVNKTLSKAVKNIYLKTDTILIQSPKFEESIKNKGINPSKIEYIPNWAEDLFTDARIDKEKYINLFPKGFIVMFAGNIGESQDIDSLLKAIIFSRENKEIKWVFVGEGRKKQYLEEQIEKNKLTDTVILLGGFPLSEMPDLFIHADVMLVSLKSEYIFSLTIPSKIQSYMAFGKPIVSMLNGVGSEIIDEAACGLTANSEDYKQLVRNIETLSVYPIEKLDTMGKNAKEYYSLHFSKNQIISKLVDLFVNKTQK